ncbi:MAG: AI-2E family transporter [Leptolyngbyaceae cyanobacterium]|mgnify:FL=1
MTGRDQPSIVPPLVAIAAFIIIVAGLKAASELIGPVLLSLFIVLVTSPLVQWMRARRVPTWLANLIVILGVIATGLLLITFLITSVAQLTNSVPEYRSLLETQFTQAELWLDRHGLESADILNLEILRPSRLIQFVLSLLTGLIGTLGNVGLTLFIVIYMLVGASSFSAKLKRSLGERSPMLNRMTAFGRSVSLYLLIKGWLGAMAAIGQTLLLLALGVDFAVLWGVVSFLFNFIPNIGYIIALMPPLILALLESGIGTALVVFIGYALINNFFDMVIGPRYLGQGLDLSTLVTFLAVVFWTWILGPVGAFLALPLTVMFKTLVLESFPDSAIAAKLMGADEAEEA